MKRILCLILVLTSLFSIVGCSKDPNAVSPATAKQLEKLTAVKTASAGGAKTVHPGSNITYTLSFTNNNDKAVSLNVSDTLPEGTTLVSGCETVSGNALSWTLDRLDPGQTTAITYTVKNNYTLKGIRASETDTVLKNTTAKVMDKEIPAPQDIYVLETFNKEDIRKFSMAIDSMVNANLTAKNTSNKPVCEVNLLAMLYNTAFTVGTNFGSTDSAEILNMIFEDASKDTVENNGGVEDVVEKATNLLHRVAPTLYGGAKVPAEKDKLFRGARATSVTIDQLVTGDAIFAEANGEIKVYVVDGQHLVHLGKTEITRKIDPATVLPGLPQADRYVVIRPSIDLNITFSLNEGEYYNDADKEGYTDKEKALIATAEAYLLRGDRFQYTDDQTSKDTYRWEHASRQPEDCTVDQYGYSNCAAFVYDVHWATLGLKATGNSKTLNTTKNNAAYAKSKWDMETGTSSSKSVVFYAEPMLKDDSGNYVSTLDDAGKAALKEKIVSVLRPGDIINIRRTTKSGHAMLYVGNGTIIHSSGSNYSEKNQTDTHEATARFRMVEDLFDVEVYSETSCIYNLESVSILRLQNHTTKDLPENTVNRVANMQGIIAEKVSSSAMGQTINCGDEVTFSFYIFNTTNEDKVIPIRDEVAQAATFVSATDGGTCTDGVIAWDVTVPADSRICVSYTVKANENLKNYVRMDGAKATIGGVAHKCFDAVVANTLTDEQQVTLVEAVNTVKAQDVSQLISPEIASLIYETAFGTANIFGEQVKTFAQLVDGDGEPHVGVFLKTSGSTLSVSDVNKSPASLMIAPGLIGGYNLSGNNTNSPFYRYLNLVDAPLRSRYFWEKDLIVGDLFMMKSATEERLYIYTGNNTFVSLDPAAGFATETVSAVFEGAPTHSWLATAVLRPSMALDI